MQKYKKDHDMCSVESITDIDKKAVFYDKKPQIYTPSK